MTESDEPNEQDVSADVMPPAQEAIGLAKWQRLLTVTATLLTLFAVCAIAIRLGMAIHHTLLLFALGGLVAYALDPLVELVRRPALGKSGRRLSKTTSVFVVYGVIFLAFAGGVAWLGGQAAHQIRILQREAPHYRDRAIQMAHEFDANVLTPRGVDYSLENEITQPPPELTAYGERLSQQALPLIAHTLSNLAESVIVLLIALYLLIFGSEMKERANRSLSPHLLRYALPWEEDVNRILGGFVRGQLILALINGVCAAIGLLALGVHLWLLIGLFVVAASLIPVFGPYIAGVPAILAALIAPTHLSPIGGAVAVLILFVVINEVGSKVLYPKLVGEALNLHEVVVLFVLFAGIEIGGIVGALLAAPVASLAIVTLVHLYRLWQESSEEPIADEILRNNRKQAGAKVFKRTKPKPA